MRPSEGDISGHDNSLSLLFLDFPPMQNLRVPCSLLRYSLVWRWSSRKDMLLQRKRVDELRGVSDRLSESTLWHGWPHIGCDVLWKGMDIVRQLNLDALISGASVTGGAALQAVGARATAT